MITPRVSANDFNVIKPLHGLEDAQALDLPNQDRLAGLPVDEQPALSLSVGVGYSVNYFSGRGGGSVSRPTTPCFGSLL